MTLQELLPAIPDEVQRHPSALEATSAADVVVARANALQVTDTVSYTEGSTLAQNINAAIKRLDAERDSVVRPLNETVKRINSWFKTPVTKLEAAKETLRRRLIAYDQAERRKAEEVRRQAEEEERARRLEAARIAAEAAAKAKAEAERLAKEAEARQQAEDAARQAAVEAAKSGDKAAQQAAEEQARRERLERLKVENEREREWEEANERARQAAAEAARPVVITPVATPVKIAGQARRTVWKYEIIDTNKIPNGFWMVNERLIDACVKTNKSKAAEILGGGVRVWEESDISFRSK